MFLVEIIALGLSNIRRHALRSLLTALGIILGVAAVIAMVSIGEGAKRDALQQLERLGAKNIIIRSQRPAESASGGQGASWTARYGLTRDDERLLRQAFPRAEGLVALKEIGGQVIRDNLRVTSQAFGTTPELSEVAGLRVARGRYLSSEDVDERATVAVLGSEIARLLFPFDDPLDQTIRVDSKPFKVVGVLKPVGLAGGAGRTLVGRDLNLDVHVPISTANDVFGDMVMRVSAGNRTRASIQLSELYLVAPSREEVLLYADVARRIVEVRHPGMTDVAMVVPYELLEQARATAGTYQAILASIAGISLLVGGIGIMNIMLATVTERTREIGIRRALGATRGHILTQFIIETGVLSAAGGVVGVGVGIGLTAALGDISDGKLPSHIAPWSIFMAFGVATATGLIFGIYPALRAARQDPIVALRHD